MLIRFEDTNATIEIPDDAAFRAALNAAAFDWPYREARELGAPVATVRASGGSYEVTAPDEEPFTATAVSAACSVIVDAVKAAIEANPSRLCFHCGSVLLGGQLVLLAGPFRAGKSSLIARMAADGHAVFGDDVLPLDEEDLRGVAIGVAPRLRLPLPASSSKAMRAFVTQWATAQDDRYLYFRPPSLAMRGANAPLGAVVLLDRRTDGPAQLLQATEGAALRSLIARNFSRADSAQELLDRLHGVAARLPRFTLRYSSLEEAAALLGRVFVDGAPPPERYPLAETKSMEEAAGAPAVASLNQDLLLRRNPAVRMRTVDGEVFLTDAEGWGIHHLNASGAGLWRLLEQPVTTREAVDVMAAAFPAVSRQMLEQDVSDLFAALHAQGFVIEAGAPADCTTRVGRP